MEAATSSYDSDRIAINTVSVGDHPPNAALRHLRIEGSCEQPWGLVSQSGWSQFAEEKVNVLTSSISRGVKGTLIALTRAWFAFCLRRRQSFTVSASLWA